MLIFIFVINMRLLLFFVDHIQLRLLFFLIDYIQFWCGDFLYVVGEEVLWLSIFNGEDLFQNLYWGELNWGVLKKLCLWKFVVNVRVEKDLSTLDCVVASYNLTYSLTVPVYFGTRSWNCTSCPAKILIIVNDQVESFQIKVHFSGTYIAAHFGCLFLLPLENYTSRILAF